MEKSKDSFTSLDEYIRTFPQAVQEKLQAMRKTIHAAAPEATEKISYQMPTFYPERQPGAFWRLHEPYRVLPTPRGIEAFQQELSAYKGSKGAVQFPR